MHIPKKTGIVFTLLFLTAAVSMFTLSLFQNAAVPSRATIRVSASAQSVCSNNNEFTILVKLQNKESESIKVIATDIKTGKSIDMGTIKGGSSTQGTINTGLKGGGDGQVKLQISWASKSGSDTATINYLKETCDDNKIKTYFTLQTDCKADTWKITSYNPSFNLSDVTNFMVEVDGIAYNSLYATGPWKGKSEIYFWIHIYLKDGTHMSSDRSERKVCTSVTPTKTPTPKPSATKTPTPIKTKTPTPKPSNTPVPSKTPTPKPSNTPTPSKTPTPKPSNTPTPSKTPTPTPSKTPTPIPSATVTATPVPSPTVTPEPSSTITLTPTMCPVPAAVTNVRINCPLCQ